jgi:hypothetical protein
MMMGMSDSRRSARHVESVEPGQPQVKDEQVRAAGACLVQGGRAVGRHEDFEASVFQDVADEPPDIRLVLGHEDQCYGHVILDGRVGV